MLSQSLVFHRPPAVFRYIGSTILAIVLIYYFSAPQRVRSRVTIEYREHIRQRPHRWYQGVWWSPRILSNPGNVSGHDQAHHLAKGIPQNTKPHISLSTQQGPLNPLPVGAHPIDDLMARAETSFRETLSRQSQSVAEAARAYRQRRARHPPPGFDKWYQFASEKNAILVEDFWDQIYDDLNPFWALPAMQIRQDAWDFEMTINIRGGKATAGSNWFWTQIWLDMIQSVAHLLPDMDIALNAMDEPRLVVPWEMVKNYMEEATRSVHMAKPEDVIGNFERLPMPQQWEEGRRQQSQQVKTTHKAWETSAPYWNIVRRGCSPTSQAHQTEAPTHLDHAPYISSAANLGHMYRGFVANDSLSRDICHQPDLRGLQGIFIEPLSISSTKSLFPMFGGSKLSVNNEILLPAPMYWSDDERFSAAGEKGSDWAEKEDRAVWRGVASGGRNRDSNWRGFQRHRFVAMNNGSQLSRTEGVPENFAPPGASYRLGAQSDGRLGVWVESWSDCCFVDLMCSEEAEHGRCPYTDAHFSVGKGLPLKEQFNNKYLPDVDGNSFSGRYLAFLRSSSLPIKATIWREWHDSRLMAWKHYVPMDNRYGDWFGIMEYFLGYGDSIPGHDAAAEKIATEGKEWAEKVLRKEDMQVYTLRLLLEYARVSDERREHMGWVGDLLPTK